MDVPMIVCKSCGVTVARRGSRHLYCSPCKKKVIAQGAKKWRKTSKENGLKYPHKGKCKTCKTEIMRVNGNHIFCDPCGKEQHKQERRLFNKRENEIISDQVIIDRLRTCPSHKCIPREMFPQELIILTRVLTSIDRHTRGKRYGTK